MNDELADKILELLDAAVKEYEKQTGEKCIVIFGTKDDMLTSTSSDNWNSVEKSHIASAVIASVASAILLED